MTDFMTDDETFNLTEYINNYKGPIRAKRLIYIADMAKDELLQKQAVEFAIDELKTNENIEEYESLVKKYERFGFTYDSEWVRDTQQKAMKDIQRMESDESSARNNNLSEELRKAKKTLGRYYLRTGNEKKAMSYFMKMNEGYSRPEDIVEMSIEVIKCALLIKNYSIVHQYVTKALQSGEKIKSKVTRSLLDIASGIALLDSNNFQGAAKRLLRADISVQGHVEYICSCEDVTIMTTLCALATFSRKELNDPEYAVQANKAALSKKQRRRGRVEDHQIVSVINNTQFANFLDTFPLARDIVNDYYNSKFSSCFTMINSLCDRLQLDYHFSRFYVRVSKLARSKAIKQYVTPYSSVDMKIMAPEFNCNVTKLERELVELIRRGNIRARIDSHKKILYAPLTNQRLRILNRINDLSENYLRTTEDQILRMNTLKYQKFTVNDHPRNKKKSLVHRMGM